MKKSTREEMKEFFKNKQMHTLDEVIQEFDCGRMTAFRYFKEGNFLTSINCRGQYHILAAGVKFNRYGLYKKDGVVFSKHGNLLETITFLISDSSSGVSVSEVGRLVGTSVNMQCHALFKKGFIYREKYGKEYIYFAVETNKRKKQLVERNTSTKKSLNPDIRKETFDSLCDIVRILIAFINNPHFSPKSIALSLSRRGMKISTEKVKTVFAKYHLAKKNS